MEKMYTGDIRQLNGRTITEATKIIAAAEKWSNELRTLAACCAIAGGLTLMGLGAVYVLAIMPLLKLGSVGGLVASAVAMAAAGGISFVVFQSLRWAIYLPVLRSTLDAMEAENLLAQFQSPGETGETNE